MPFHHREREVGQHPATPRQIHWAVLRPLLTCGSLNAAAPTAPVGNPKPTVIGLLSSLPVAPDFVGDAPPHIIFQAPSITYGLRPRPGKVRLLQ